MSKYTYYFNKNDNRWYVKWNHKGDHFWDQFRWLHRSNAWWGSATEILPALSRHYRPRGHILEVNSSFIISELMIVLRSQEKARMSSQKSRNLNKLKTRSITSMNQTQQRISIFKSRMYTIMFIRRKSFRRILLNAL